MSKTLAFVILIAGLAPVSLGGDFAADGFLEVGGSISIPGFGSADAQPGEATVTAAINSDAPGYILFDITAGTASPFVTLNFVNLIGAEIEQMDFELGSFDSGFTPGGGPLFASHPISSINFGDTDGIVVAPHHGRITDMALLPSTLEQFTMILDLPDTGSVASRNGNAYELALYVTPTTVPEPTALVSICALAGSLLLPTRHPKG